MSTNEFAFTSLRNDLGACLGACSKAGPPVMFGYEIEVKRPLVV